MPGLVRGVVNQTSDPADCGRLLVMHPLIGVGALPCLPPSSARADYKVGDMVWVAF